jgi:hypothetical protein
VTHSIALPATLTSLLLVASPVLAGRDGRTEPTVEPPAALLVVLAGVSGPADCLVNDSAFTTSGGGCLDLATGLVWGRSSVTFELPYLVLPFLTWQGAMAYCDALVEGGFVDWFLPTLSQMEEVVGHGSATYLNLGTTAPNFLWWSSTTKGGQRAWLVDLWGGRVVDSLKSSSVPYMCVRWAGTATAPSAPTGLIATLVGSNQVNLMWSDQSSDEEAFHVDRSVDGSNWAAVANLPPNSGGYGEANLAPGQQYSYRVWASNTGGASGFSNVESVTTNPGVSLAHTQVAVEGTVSGSMSNTWADDGIYQSITEIQTGGPPSQRRSRLEHVWQFTVASGSTVTLHVQAHRTDMGEGDTFILAYSYAGGASGSYVDLPGAITATVDNGTYTTFALPAMQAGPIYIRVRDSNRAQGFGALDVLHVDHLYVTSL